MLQILFRVLDILFPPRPTEVVVRLETRKTVARLFSLGQYQRHLYLSQYDHPLIKSLITENKFYHSAKAASLLASLLDTWAQQQSTRRIVFVPIPLSAERYRERGYNQVLEVLRRSNHITFDKTILTRTKHTPPQTANAKAARLSNMKNAFTCTNKAKVAASADTHYVLFDDVVTTGATLAAAKAALVPHLPESCTITTLALAH